MLSVVANDERLLVLELSFAFCIYCLKFCNLYEHALLESMLGLKQFGYPELIPSENLTENQLEFSCLDF